MATAVPRHRGSYAGDDSSPEAETFNRLTTYSRRSRRGLADRLDERRAMRDALRPPRTDHFGGAA